MINKLKKLLEEFYVENDCFGYEFYIEIITLIDKIEKEKKITTKVKDLCPKCGLSQECKYAEKDVTLCNKFEEKTCRNCKAFMKCSDESDFEIAITQSATPCKKTQKVFY